MSVEAKAAINTNYNGGTGNPSLEQEIEYLEGLQMAMLDELSQLTNSIDKSLHEANERMLLLENQIVTIDAQIEKLKAGMHPRPQPPRDVNLEGDINGVPYQITVAGELSGGKKIISEYKLPYAGKITFTEDCRINNLHVLAADSVTALPGVDVEVDTMIIIGNNTKVSNLKVNNLITPQSASQAAKQSYNLLAPQSPREMSAEEALGWGKDLFGAQYQSFPTEKEIEDLKTLPYYPRPKINVPSAAPTDPVDPSPQGPTEPTP